ncbi:hypothetical protein HY383_02170 [Candidatus Daviesbacteria bacterium]|nr:hypothetical protein [Candidatus Daviesbacteria bacterium]
MEKNKGGRPPTTEETLDLYLRKLEPFLKSGQTLYRACLNTQIPYRTVKDWSDKSEGFSQKIDAFLSYTANLINNLHFSRLVGIATKQSKMQELLADLKAGKIKKEDFDKLCADYEISDKEWQFIAWYATHSYSTREDYGQRIDRIEENPQPLTPEADTREVAELLQAILHKNDAPEEKIVIS